MQLGEWPEFKPVDCTGTAARISRPAAWAGALDGFAANGYAIAAGSLDSDVHRSAAVTAEYFHRRGLDSFTAACSGRS